ncbi:MAG: aminodeoxychorismate/anthranilate synthase component II [Pelagibacteraceae bacterium]|jgi:anthranilate synthase/aminodeoxychorismate synthase-like glutamine amidotransferase|nr:aminodeoxychorismate/anthranilate synthase component II [Pelagibacteraceae bacterium]MBT4951226.1 aminodeoxychorismate/anthranilate synthase component II [Pelagibacteraceae bacterium]MBT5213264.1 aminodeoxychorismate/anthranilate synthase component II [Pelagibacteraceae bacterium]MBT6197727.1 aminodeoxychorismate/anthranilate synthase component II [Pelagibacteraceae bacterium]
MILLIDNYDSFTYNVKHYLNEIGAEVEIYRNDRITIKEIKEINPKAIVLSPGPCTPNEAGICLKIIENFKNTFPILGICLGHQSIGQAFGGKIIKCDEIMHGKIDFMKHFNHEIFKNIENNFLATRYHSLIIDRDTLSKDFIITAETNNKIIMGIAHSQLPIYGFQFHPESIGTEIGKDLLKNFLTLIKYGN